MITEAQLQANYFFFVLLWIVQNSTTPVNNYVSTGSLFTLSSNSSGSYINTWSTSINCSQPTDSQMMSSFNDGDEQKSIIPYNMQSAITMQTCNNNTFPYVLNNTAIPWYSQIYNTDTQQILFKVDVSKWVPIYSTAVLTDSKTIDIIKKEFDDKLKFEIDKIVDKDYHLV